MKCSKSMRYFILWMINHGPKNIFQGFSCFQLKISQICKKSSDWPFFFFFLVSCSFLFLTSLYCVQMKFVYFEVYAETTNHSMVIAKMSISLGLAYACLWLRVNVCKQWFAARVWKRCTTLRQQVSLGRLLNESYQILDMFFATASY